MKRIVIYNSICKKEQQKDAILKVTINNDWIAGIYTQISFDELWFSDTLDAISIKIFFGENNRNK